MGIPTIRDRVVQTAAVLMLSPIFEADYTDAMYGYRPRRSARQAVTAVHQALRAGYANVVDADLSGYFDTILQAELLMSVARRVSDRAMLHVLRRWLNVPVAERDAEGRVRRTGGRGHGRGTPQGGPQGPRSADLSNIKVRPPGTILDALWAQLRAQSPDSDMLSYCSDRD